MITRTTSIQLSGSSSYNVEVNGQRYDVKGDRFTTNLPTGLSIIKISTDLDCQGIIERESLYLRGYSLLSKSYTNGR